MKQNYRHLSRFTALLIATPSSKRHGRGTDQSNADLITLLADWFKDLGFKAWKRAAVPGTRTNSTCWQVSDRGLAACCWRGIPIRAIVMHGRWTRDPFTLTEHDGSFTA